MTAEYSELDVEPDFPGVTLEDAGNSMTVAERGWTCQPRLSPPSPLVATVLHDLAYYGQTDCHEQRNQYADCQQQFPGFRLYPHLHLPSPWRF
jgi:hypothetical protein